MSNHRPIHFTVATPSRASESAIRAANTRRRNVEGRALFKIDVLQNPFRVRGRWTENPGLTDIRRSTLGSAAQPLPGLKRRVAHLVEVGNKFGKWLDLIYMQFMLDAVTIPA